MSRKTNPRNVPRSQEDVDRAREKGIREGVANASAMFLMVMVDKFDAADQIAEIWREILKLSDEVLEHRVSIADLRVTLREEYGVEV